jgi:hypothetical protein
MLEKVFTNILLQRLIRKWLTWHKLSMLQKTQQGIKFFMVLQQQKKDYSFIVCLITMHIEQ